MRAIVIQHYGRPEQLATQAFPNPEPKSGHVVIEVKAFGVNHAETLMRKGEWVAENLVQKVSKEKVRNLIERWLTAEEERRLLSAFPGWLQGIIVFLANTGLRQSEILNFQCDNVDLFRRTITLLEQRTEAETRFQ